MRLVHQRTYTATFTCMHGYMAIVRHSICQHLDSQPPVLRSSINTGENWTNCSQSDWAQNCSQSMSCCHQRLAHCTDFIHAPYSCQKHTLARFCANTAASYKPHCGSRLQTSALPASHSFSDRLLIESGWHHCLHGTAERWLLTTINAISQGSHEMLAADSMPLCSLSSTP